MPASAVTDRPLVRAIAAHGIAGTLRAFPEAPLEETVWRDLLAVAAMQRLLGLLVDALVQGAFPATDEQLTLAGRAHHEAMARVLVLERRLLETVRVLADEGIDVRAVKGPVTAHAVYPNPALRTFGDVDVLVPTEQFDAAAAVFERSGHRRRWPQLRPGFDRRFGKGATLLAPDHLEVDLHRTFVQGVYGMTVDLPSLFATRSTVRIGGIDVPTIAPAHRILHACYHAALGDAPPRLATLRDVAQMVLYTDYDPAEVLGIAREWHGEAVVARALTLTWEHLAIADSVPLSAWAHRHHPTAQEERALARYTQPSRTYAGKAVTALRAIPRVRDKASYLSALVLPDRSTVTRYERGYAAWWRRGSRFLSPGRRDGGGGRG